MIQRIEYDFPLSKAALTVGVDELLKEIFPQSKNPLWQTYDLMLEKCYQKMEEIKMLQAMERKEPWGRP